jgi:hypothetical protein
MRKIQLLVLISVVAMLGIGAAGAAAAKPGHETCSGGTIESGTYNGFTVTGNCTFAPGAVVTIDGNLTVADGAILNDHAGVPASVHVTGNVQVGKGAVLGLGSYNPFAQQQTTVDGNIVANAPASLYLSFMTVRGNLVSNGGGDAGRNLPLKDITVGGNLIVQGWSGLWFGIIRDTVGGNVIVSNNVAVDPSQLPGDDSTEVANNPFIGGNLICHGNVPAAQLGDTEQPGSTVAGKKIGECAGL